MGACKFVHDPVMDRQRVSVPTQNNRAYPTDLSAAASNKSDTMSEQCQARPVNLMGPAKALNRMFICAGMLPFVLFLPLSRVDIRNVPEQFEEPSACTYSCCCC